LKVEFYRHNLGIEEKNKVNECLDDVFLTTGSYVKEFEEKFAKYLNLRHVVGLSSCTAALHLSLLALNIGPGDEVITVPMTFIATATAIMHTGAKPVFVDVDPETGLIDPTKIDDAINVNTKAIIPVHLYGQMCDMVQIKAIAEKHNLKIVEDSAHCIEGERNGIKPGQLGNVACFSFYATKNITSGEGGAIATNDKALFERVLILRQHGMSMEAAERYSRRYQHWDMIDCGWKYNMSNIQASLLLPQVEKIDENWEKRKRIYDKYMNGIKSIPSIHYPKIEKNVKSALHLLTVWVDINKRDFILNKLCDAEIGVAVNYRAIHLLNYFKKTFGFHKGAFPNAESIGDSTISLPFFIKISENEIDYVLKTLKNILI
jgi:dTDP-4-amino-4,6-dideoxygalactose transaminase